MSLEDQSYDCASDSVSLYDGNSDDLLEKFCNSAYPITSSESSLKVFFWDRQIRQPWRLCSGVGVRQSRLVRVAGVDLCRCPYSQSCQRITGFLNDALYKFTKSYLLTYLLPPLPISTKVVCPSSLQGNEFEFHFSAERCKLSQWPSTANTSHLTR